MRLVGVVENNKREVNYLSIYENNWEKELPKKYWCVFVFGNNSLTEEMQRIARVCVNNGVCYVWAAGEQA